MKAQFNGQINPVNIDMRNCEPAQRKQYSRMMKQAGKGDRPRSVFSNAFRDGWDRVFGDRQRMIMTVLSPSDFIRYAANPCDDAWLRVMYQIPTNSYYTVSVEPVPGILRMERSREARLHKISKSDTSHESS